MSMVDILAANARAAPHEDAYVFRSHDNAEQRLSWGELWARAQHLARGIAAVVPPGERIMLIFDPGLAFIEVFFAAQIAGAVPVPMSGRFGTRSGERIQAAIASGIVTNVVSDIACQEFVCQTLADYQAVRIFKYDDLTESGQPDRHLPVTAQDAFVQFSSGSTGRPHGIFIEHRNLTRNLGLMAQLCKAQPGHASVSWLPAHHDFGLIGGILFPAFIRGAGILMAPSSFVRRPRTWLELITRYRAAFTGAPNFGYDLVAKRVSNVEGLDLRSLRIAINGAERVQADTLRRFEDRFAQAGLRTEALRPCYGLAEATLLVSGATDGRWKSRRFDREQLKRNRLVAASDCDREVVELVSNGCPIVDQLKIMSDDRIVEPGQIGEILVADLSVSRSADARVLRSGSQPESWACTGDLGALVDGELYVVGRLKDLVIRDGVNIHLEEIDNVIDELVLPGRLQAICSFRLSGTEDIGVLVEDSRTAPLRPTIGDEIRAAIMRHFGIKLLEVTIVPAGGIPRTTSGKKQRFACPAIFGSGEGAGQNLGTR
ncbi:AMP-binding protein [Sphingobium subterraneum]|uniref:Acyl-CoA synthetase (AMP-forming)/AMP-acid ligase II n=1 Tax=Sphingobium subterraneum TaxID=627688 RepID=A0A841IVD5_9SPHN|nr:AMP-binding protein [Sphingobium subterraneum]MBB6122879.1 acyl-CoA synthetase (AMP-forming)/AMP-acid ligase II [Sphingobium subterraneum]